MTFHIHNLGILFLLLGAQLITTAVHCRTLRNSVGNVDGFEHYQTPETEAAAGKTMGKAAAFSVSSPTCGGKDCSSSRKGNSVKSMAFILASGPSKRGAGH
ncbi:unnamed protein product [Cuscuta epithymum]|uniref:Uncharacterized protein n=1 Tax=Cuscuta epithymum TaxID=186058 RepID=A0AAV0CI91_9ASTE|nr:unnamed protein product [Cuscuta epithymum]